MSMTSDAVDKVLIDMKNWALHEFAGDSGSIIYHKKCKNYTTVLDQHQPHCDNPDCTGIASYIPKKIQALYTLHNFDKAQDGNFFLQADGREWKKDKQATLKHMKKYPEAPVTDLRKHLTAVLAVELKKYKNKRK